MKTAPLGMLEMICSRCLIALPEGTRAVSDAKPVTIALDDGTHVSGLLQAPTNARACYVLAHGAGAGMTHAVHGGGRDGACGARHRDLALPVPLHGERRQAARSAEARARGRARRRRRSRAPAAEASADRRRQIVRRPHDLAGAGRARHCPACAGSRSSDFRCIRPDARRRIAPSISFDVQIPMLFLQGTRDQLALLDQLEPLCKALGQRATLALFRTPIIPSTCRRGPAARMRRSAPTC